MGGDKGNLWDHTSRVKKYNDMSMEGLRNEKFKHISYRKTKRIIAGRE